MGHILLHHVQPTVRTQQPHPGCMYGHMFTLKSVRVHCSRFVENILHHSTPKSGFDSFAEYIQCLQEGTVRLKATCDFKVGAEIYVRHVPGEIQWSCTLT